MIPRSRQVCVILVAGYRGGSGDEALEAYQWY
jgi:hypothetical protein